MMSLPSSLGNALSEGIGNGRRSADFVQNRDYCGGFASAQLFPITARTAVR
jgi:hypothetical protein